MARVTAPLLSLDASGTVGKTATFSKWKGRNYVRLRVTPQNPQSNSQAQVRTILAALGKTVKKIESDSTLYNQIVAVTPNDQSWSSYIMKTITGVNNADFAVSKAAYELAGNATVAGYFDTEAASLGLSSFGLSYGTYGEVTGGLMLWALASAAFRLGLAIAPVAPEDLSQGQVTAFAAAMSAA